MLHQPHGAELRRPRGVDHTILPTQRHSRRHGLAAGFIDTLSQTLIQISLFVLDLLRVRHRLRTVARSRRAERAGDDRNDRLGALIVAVLVVIFVPSVRRRVVEPFRQMKDAFQVLRMPGKVLDLIGGNLGSEILFAITLAIVTRAYGYELPLSTSSSSSTPSSHCSRASFPVPGGIGVTEAGLTWDSPRPASPTTPRSRSPRRTA